MPVLIESSDGNIFAGGEGADGDVVLRSSGGEDRIRFDASGGNGWLGGNGADGDLLLFRANGDNQSVDQASVHLDGNGGDIFAGGQGANGALVLRDPSGQDRVRLLASGGNAWLGGNGADGDLALFPAAGDNQTIAQATIHLNGESGDIILQNADCAEEFPVQDPSVTDAGTLMVIGDDLQLRVSDCAYDQRVAGVVAGAGSYRPGIVLGRHPGIADCVPIALLGRTMCKVVAEAGSIRVGDLLTTSAVPGHAMRVDDPLRAFGAVIGKALGTLEAGKGMIPVLVALQ